MIIALQLVLGILLLGAVIWVGDLVSREIDGALGDRPLRDRDG